MMVTVKGVTLAVGCLVFFSGFVIVSAYLSGWWPGSDEGEGEGGGSRTSVSETIDDFIIREVNHDNIRNNLRHLTLKPHVAGTPAELETAKWVEETWRAQGMDEVHQVAYQVLLSYPEKDTPNLVRILNDSGAAVWTSPGRQKPLYAPEEASPDVLPDFNAYSAPGSVAGDVVYAHFGREEDFKALENLGVEVKGRIVMARYGEVFRGNIAATAEGRGAVGVLLYPDPQQFSPLGEEEVYPSTVYLPGSGVPVGTVFTHDGDPLTLLYPAVDSAYRMSESKANLPRIPIQPISYDDARHILRHMGGELVPSGWQGGLNVTYRLGPGLAETGWKVTMEVLTHNVPTTIYDVVSVIRGSEEPDRYVILGNHRDAWYLGGLDPSSSTAALLELSRVLNVLRNETGWQPRRSVVLCSWGAEEYGLVGSMEWSEQFHKQLMARTTAYLNVDMAIDGNYTLRAQSTPLLYHLLFEAAAKIPNPDPEEIAAGRPTVYDTWTLRRPDTDHPGRPSVAILGSGSDYKAFQHNLGVPSLDVRYTHGPGLYTQPLYHTLYETFAAADELYDRGFNFQAAVTQMWAVMAVNLADAQLLPFSLVEYGDFVTVAFDQLVEHYGDLISSRNITLDYFCAAVTEFSQAARNFTNNIININSTNPLAVRRVNDQMMMVERAMIDPHGLPGRPDYNHVVMVPSISNIYASTAFAGLTDALDGITDLDPEQQEERWDQFSQHLAAVTYYVTTAGKVLSDDLW
ncbi:putative N-acetylated-alpha-linked acidic dipeptidase isoform X1 [Homarus americanus]|uniref:putative N-acetylated-alpha-linked acidic dipeptidase isoform X1 n=1 Tax=Homarus americanus TaxID=6706 RepID=UPI001C44468D|nr:putative N-acetylated-alpha-linked acidic dipeptidase isoform X1 [Homarus americanus]